MVVKPLHLCKGEKFMRKLFTSQSGTDGIFFSLGPSLCDDDYYPLFTHYFIDIGLAREMYLTKNRNGLYPLHCICSNSYHTLTRLKMVPLYILDEALTLKNKKGNTMIHFTFEGPRVCDRTLFFPICHREKLEIISKAEGYDAALLALNNRGRTPLHEAILNCNTIDTILFLLESPSGKKAVSVKDKDGKTPYDLFMEVRHCYGGKNIETATFILGIFNPCQEL